MVNVNDFWGSTDNEVLEAAIKNRQKDGIVLIPPRASEIETERDYWLLDRAILLPEDTTVILQNCTIKLSDLCRDNFFRSANCGLGIAEPKKIYNVYIKGEGMCSLLGADHPRATGDAGKILARPCPYEPEDLCRLADWIPMERRTPETLDFWDAHDHSYGTDAGKEGEHQNGDWRDIGILMANVDHFGIENLRIIDSHGWGITMEACSCGIIRNINFEACMSRMIDGLRQNIENQDGIDVRNGCHNLIISDITGRTGDDMVALTAIALDGYTGSTEGGRIGSGEVMPVDWSKRDKNIHDIIIRNIIGYSNLCWQVRLLPCNCKIWNVVIDGVIDTAPDGLIHGGGLIIGEADFAYGMNLPDGLKNISISNVIAQGNHALRIDGYLKDSMISNVMNRNPNGLTWEVCREDGMTGWNVKMSNVVEAT